MITVGVRRLLRPPPTALIVPVPAAHVAVEAYNRRTGPLEPGMPPHVTVLWPFLRRFGRSDRTLLDEVGAAIEPFEFDLAAIGRFPGVTFLRPQPSEPFVRLTKLVWERWPQHPPYEGAFDDVVPHVTLAHEDEPLATDALDDLLPLTTRATELVALQPWRGRWRPLYRVELGASRR